MKQDAKILVVDDNEDILLAARLLLRQYVSVVRTEKDPNLIPDILKGNGFDVILLDMNFAKDVSSGQEGFAWLGRILEIDPQAVVILVTAYGDVDMAVRAIKEGATDFILKPWQNEKLVATISAALNLRRSRRETERLRNRQKQLSADLDKPYHDFIGDSAAIRQVMGMVDKVAETDASVLVLGENGTGKELVAREIHRRSGRRDNVFISVDMGAITETLFESELFGYVRGAFTGAVEDKAGRFETAEGGTLFLDEIGNLPLAAQSKLLAVLENRRVTRLGQNSSRPIDIRLITATNQLVHQMVTNGQFRRDLLYRINTVEISLPPLRERVEDISLLAEYFLDRYRRKYQKSVEKIGPSGLKALERCHWPGNVRELKHAIERAVIMSDTKVLQADDFFPSTGASYDGDFQFDDYNLEQMEKIAILKTISKHKGNISQAARELGLTRASLYRRMQKYGL